MKKTLAQIEEQLKPLLMKFESERGRLDEIRTLKEKLEDLKNKAENAQRLAFRINLIVSVQY